MNTKLARDMGLEFPIFAFTHCRDVAAAVSKAGGMGVFGVAAHSAKGLRAELEWIEKENRNLLELLGTRYERLAATGGKPVDDIFGYFPEMDWDRLVFSFLHTAKKSETIS